MGIGPLEGTIVPPRKLLTGLLPNERVRGVFDMNYGASINEIKDGTSNTIMLSELMGGHQITIRGVQAHAWGPFVMADYSPNDRTPDIVLYCDPEDKVPAPAPYAGCQFVG